MAYTFFGLQVALKNFHRDPLRRHLHALIGEDTAQRVGVQNKRTFWKRFSAMVVEAAPLFEFGDWDLKRDASAQDTFDHWASTIEGGAATEREELGGAADEAHRLSGAPSYILATMMVLVDRGTNADNTLGEWCDLDQSEWLTRQTFGHLLSVFPRLNFANVQADAVYLIPGDDSDGLSYEDLRSPDFAHLKPLT
jgi:hypothetical protein